MTERSQCACANSLVILLLLDFVHTRLSAVTCFTNALHFNVTQLVTDAEINIQVGGEGISLYVVIYLQIS